MDFASVNWLWIVIIVWLFLDIVLAIIWVGRFLPFIENLIHILTKPIISIKDQNPSNVPFYPRELLENISNGLRSRFGKFLGFIISFLLDVVYRIIYVVISISLYFILTPIEFFRRLLFPPLIGKIESEPSQKKKKKKSKGENNFRLSVAYPRFLSKRYSSPFKVVIYPPTEQGELGKLLNQDSGKTNVSSSTETLKFKVGVSIVIELSSQEIEFTKSVTKKLLKGVNIIEFIGKPKDGCYSGKHWVKLSLIDKETNHEYLSHLFEVKVVDFAFDHVSRPFLSGLVSLVLGLGSFVTYALTLLGKVDQVFGLTSGTAAALIATVIYGRLFDLYRRTKETTNIMK